MTVPNADEDAEDGISHTLLMGLEPLWKVIWRFLKLNSNIELPYDPVILSLGVYAREMKI